MRNTDRTQTSLLSTNMATLTVLLCMAIAVTNGATYPDLQRLHQNLTATYNKDLRPVFNLSEPTNISVSFNLFSIKELEVMSNKLVIVGMFSLTWNDYKMTWNPAEFGHIDATHIAQSKIWKPDIRLLNPYDKVEPFGFDDQNVLLLFTGTLYWSTLNVYQSYCPMDITLYPFDEQTCELVFMPWMYTIADMSLSSKLNSLNLNGFYASPLWELKDTGIEIKTITYDSYALQLVFITLHLKRRPLFHVLNTLIPISIMGFLNTVVFLLPAESGERVGFSVTVLLSMAVYMTMVTDNLPSTSEPAVSKLCYLFLADLIINASVTLSTIIGLRCHHKPEEERVPHFLQRLVNMPLLCRREKIQGMDVTYTSETSRTVECPISSLQLANDYNRAKHDMSMDTGRGEHTECKQENETIVKLNGSENDEQARQCKDKHSLTTWKNIAVFLDGILFILFLIILAAKNIAVVITFL